MNTDPSTWLLSVLAFAVSMAGTPGPNNAMVAASGATFGFARTLPHMLGVAVGFTVMLALVALGAGDLLHRVPAIQRVLRWAGAAYMVWLAVRIALARPKPAGTDVAQAAQGARPLNLWQAALFQWVNPKAWIIAVGGVTTYLTAERGTWLLQGGMLAGIFFVVTIAALVFWTWVGVGAARLLRTERMLRGFNLAMAALLLASLLPLLRDG